MSLRIKIPKNYTSIGFIISLACLSFVSCSSQSQFVLLFEQRTGAPDWLRRIYSVHPDGSTIDLLIELDDNTVEFYWLSPNSKYLAVLNLEIREIPSTDPLARNLSIIDLSTEQIIATIEGVGQTRSQHFTNESSVAWSPEGDKLVFIKNTATDIGTDLFIYDLQTGKTNFLTNDAAFDLAPVWSPNSEQVAFVTGPMCRESADNCSSIDEAYWELAVVNTDGSKKQILSNFHENGLLELSGWTTLLCNLVWSPNGRYIAFENDCGILLGPPITKEAFVISIDSSLLLKLTNFVKEHEIASTVFRYSFHWTPSSTTLFVGYSKIPYVPDEGFRGGILVLEAEDFTYSPVEDMPLMRGSTAQWSPDGQYLAWHSARINEDRRRIPGPVNIGLIVDNQISVLVDFSQLPYGSCQDSTLIWSPNREYLAYGMVREEDICDDNKRSIAVVSISNARVTNVTESIEGDNHPIGWIQLNALKSQ